MMGDYCLTPLGRDLLSAHWRTIRRCAYAYAGSLDPDDALDVAVQAATAAVAGQHPCPVEAAIVKRIRCRLIDALRQRSRRRTWRILPDSASTVDDHERTDLLARWPAVESAMARLPIRQRQALSSWMGYDARPADMTRHSARSHAMRGIRALRAVI